MAIRLVSNLQNVWPFSLLKSDQLRASDKLVRRLCITEHTKTFVFTIREPESKSVMHIFCAHNLSEKSASDVECLIREVRPDDVVAQVGVQNKVQCEEIELGDKGDDSIPTSLFGVIKRCFVDSIGRTVYENAAGNLVLREIFGIGFIGDKGQCLVPQKVGLVVSSISRRFYLTNDVESQMVRLLSSDMDLFGLRLRPPNYNLDSSKEFQLRCGHLILSFAQSIYPLLLDLHNVFADHTSMSRALALAQKMLFDVNIAEVVDTEVIY
ncbi:uncharacterized protein LOC116131052 [Pistacia vera]|uniref:uncharacterized protein LOC116131052 n=1 Tax=Pistacia vera TaxID=55513 RepID=UPI001262B22A|nr:uncharacterized protein LOC116131052 [Pistacia vera]